MVCSGISGAGVEDKNKNELEKKDVFSSNVVSMENGYNTDVSNQLLVLKSPWASGEEKVYRWPLKMGKGNLRRSEDKHDEAAEIVDTIQWVCEDFREISEVFEYQYGSVSQGLPISVGSKRIASYDTTNYESMLALCNLYNQAVDKILKKSKKDKKNPNINSKVTRPHLRHILQKCYNVSVVDPNELNHYEAFTPEVYGETSFELICQMIDQLSPIRRENRFIDLGSGVGQVVLQVAALTECQMCLGIEKAVTPAKYAEGMEMWFRFWMKFYGKRYSDFRLVTGDFLDEVQRPDVLSSTIVFVNNFAFGPEVDQYLKDIFADLSDGARIFSSKSFCALNFRITDRNLSDIGTIMHVSKMDPLKGSVSWTGRPVCYYLHLIDRAKLERYFQRSAARRGEKDEDISRRRKSVAQQNNLESSLEDKNSLNIKVEDESNVDASFPTGVVQTTDVAIKTENNTTSPVTRAAAANSLVVVENRRNKINLKKLVKKKIKKTKEAGSIKKKKVALRIRGVGYSSIESNKSSSRPVRAAVANAAAISEAQQDIDAQIADEPLPSGSRRKWVRKTALPKNEVVIDKPTDANEENESMFVTPPTLRLREHSNLSVSQDSKKSTGTATTKSTPKINLDVLHELTTSHIKAAVNDSSAPIGCINEELTHHTPSSLVHNEITSSLLAMENGEQIPYRLQLYLEKCKKLYLQALLDFKHPNYKKRIQDLITARQEYNNKIIDKETKMRQTIANLLRDCLALLKPRLHELNVQAKQPSTEFKDKSHGVAWKRHDLLHSKRNLDVEIQRLETDREKLQTTMEEEVFEKAQILGYGPVEARSLARKKIEIACNGERQNTKVTSCDLLQSPVLLNKLSDITFTRLSPPARSSTPPPAHSPLTSYYASVASDNSSAASVTPTHVRKRQRDGKIQKDWPEKRHRIVTSVGGPWPEDGAIIQVDDKMFDDSPVIKRIIEIGDVNGGRHINPATLVSNQTQSEPVPPKAHQNSHYLLHRNISSVSPVSKYDSVNLPKIDISQSMANVRQKSIPAKSNYPSDSACGSHQPPESLSSSMRYQPSVDPSAVRIGVVGCSTPRAEQFDLRLKNIFHTVLNGDAEHRQRAPNVFRKGDSFSNTSRRYADPIENSDNSKVNLEGLACPRTTSSPETVAAIGLNHLSTPGYPVSHSYPVVEGLTARFNQYSMQENISKQHHVRVMRHPQYSAESYGRSTMNVVNDSHSPHNSCTEPYVNDRYSGPSHLYGSPHFSRQFNRMPYQVAHIRYPASDPGILGIRTRLPNSDQAPGMVSREHVVGSTKTQDYTDFRQRGETTVTTKVQVVENERSSIINQQQWQDEISTGFDRLVAYATEVVDKRRKSNENSPNSHRNAIAVTAVPASESSRVSMLSMKFKGHCQNSGVSSTSQQFRSSFATTAIPDSSSIITIVTSTDQLLNTKSLYEHHPPKKRYFTESRNS